MTGAIRPPEQRPQVVDHARAILLEPAIGHPNHPKTVPLQRGIAPPVVLESRTRAVEPVAVDLHHEALFEPGRVDLIAGNEEVHRRTRKACDVAHLAEDALHRIVHLSHAAQDHQARRTGRHARVTSSYG